MKGLNKLGTYLGLSIDFYLYFGGRDFTTWNIIVFGPPAAVLKIYFYFELRSHSYSSGNSIGESSPDTVWKTITQPSCTISLVLEIQNFMQLNCAIFQKQNWLLMCTQIYIICSCRNVYFTVIGWFYYNY